MTEGRSFKRQVRERMTRDGVSYSTARRRQLSPVAWPNNLVVRTASPGFRRADELSGVITADGTIDIPDAPWITTAHTQQVEAYRVFGFDGGVHVAFVGPNGADKVTVFQFKSAGAARDGLGLIPPRLDAPDIGFRGARAATDADGDHLRVVAWFMRDRYLVALACLRLAGADPLHPARALARRQFDHLGALS